MSKGVHNFPKGINPSSNSLTSRLQYNTLAITLWMIEKKKKKKIHSVTDPRKLWLKAKFAHAWKTDLLVPRKKPVLIQQWPLRLEKIISFLLLVGKTTCLLSLILGHSSTYGSLWWTYLWDNRTDLQTYNSPKVTLLLQSSLPTYLMDITINFGLITHQKWLIYFNALFGGCDCSLVI